MNNFRKSFYNISLNFLIFWMLFSWNSWKYWNLICDQLQYLIWHIKLCILVINIWYHYSQHFRNRLKNKFDNCSLFNPYKKIFPWFDIPCYFRKCIIFTEFMTTKHGNYRSFYFLSLFFRKCIIFAEFLRKLRKNFFTG